MAKLLLWAKLHCNALMQYVLVMEGTAMQWRLQTVGLYPWLQLIFKYCFMFSLDLVHQSLTVHQGAMSTCSVQSFLRPVSTSDDLEGYDTPYVYVHAQWDRLSPLSFCVSGIVEKPLIAGNLYAGKQRMSMIPSGHISRPLSHWFIVQWFAMNTSILRKAYMYYQIGIGIYTSCMV